MSNRDIKALGEIRDEIARLAAGLDLRFEEILEVLRQHLPQNEDDNEDE